MRPSVRFTDENGNLTRNALLLALPSLFEGFSRVLTQYVDTAMVGSLGSYATAAVGINTSVLFLLWGIMQAAGTAFSVMFASSIGAGRESRARGVVQHGLFASLLIGLLFSVLILVMGAWIPVWLGAASEVVPSAVAYIKIVGGAALFQSVSVMASALLRGSGNAKSPFAVNLIANVANIVGNILLIPAPTTFAFGQASITTFGLGLGVEGAALSTAGSMVLSAVIMLACLKRDTPSLALFSAFRPERGVFREAMSLGTPIAFERIVLAVGQIALTAMVANLGTAAMAAHYIANSISTLSYETATGFSVATTTLVAQCRGAQKPRLAYRYMVLVLKIGAAGTAVLSAIVFATAVIFTQLFTSDSSVAAMAVPLVRLDAVFEPVLAVATVLCGAFRGYGDTKFPFVVSVIGFWGVRLVFGLVFGYALGIGLLGIWIAIVFDTLVRTAMCVLHLRKTK